jgi:hypothetical protein
MRLPKSGNPILVRSNKLGISPPTTELLWLVAINVWIKLIMVHKTTSARPATPIRACRWIEGEERSLAVWSVGGSTPPPSSTLSSAFSTASPPPGAIGRRLQFGPNRNLCATVQSGNPGNGVLVNMQICNSAATSQRWTFMSNGLIQFAGTSFCLDAGPNPPNGIQMKL